MTSTVVEKCNEVNRLVHAAVSTHEQSVFAVSLWVRQEQVRRGDLLLGAHQSQRLRQDKTTTKQQQQQQQQNVIKSQGKARFIVGNENHFILKEN